MSSLDEWAEDFAKAVEDYRRSATSKMISFDSGRIFNFIMRNREEFPQMVRFIEADQWGAFRMKDMLAKYLRAAGELHKIYRVGPVDQQRTGGVLYTYKKAAGVFQGDD